MNRHLLELRDLPPEWIGELLERARFYQYNPCHRRPLENLFVANLFFEASTRTRFSFEVAARKLGAEVLNFAENVSSRVKGESVMDTLKTLEAIGVKGAVIRTAENSLLQELKDRVSISLINAGAGNREHPTQALLDLYTMQERFGSVEGLTVGIVGDIAHSRVAGSHMHLLPRLGVRLLLSGPPGLLERPDDPIPEGVERVTLDRVIREADVVMMLRIQHERHAMGMEMSAEEYHRAYGLTRERASQMKKGAVIMHPAPVNRGVEIDSSLVDSERSLIWKQIANGVFVRMAVLEAVLGGVAVV